MPKTSVEYDREAIQAQHRVTTHFPEIVLYFLQAEGLG